MTARWRKLRVPYEPIELVDTVFMWVLRAFTRRYTDTAFAYRTCVFVAVLVNGRSQRRSVNYCAVPGFHRQTVAVKQTDEVGRATDWWPGYTLHPPTVARLQLSACGLPTNCSKQPSGAIDEICPISSPTARLAEAIASRFAVFASVCARVRVCMYARRSITGHQIGRAHV